MKIRAYAKVNLILKVIDKMANGYHELQMLNTKINIYDEIDIEQTNENVDELYFQNSNLDSKKDNLVLKCLKLVKDIYNIRDSYKIIITKNIPTGAGLGGGSSDAAHVVRYILERYEIKKEKKLIDELSKLGADIPFFLYDGICIVEGIGEKVTECKINIPKEFVLVNPNIWISTKDVFNSNIKKSLKLSHSDLIRQVENTGCLSFVNDLENACFGLNNELEQIKNNLNKIAYCTMSGSGSTMLLFDINNDSKKIDKIYNECIRLYPNYYIKKVEIL